MKPRVCDGCGHVHCPIHGSIYNDEQGYFHCPKCRRQYGLLMQMAIGNYWTAIDVQEREHTPDNR